MGDLGSIPELGRSPGEGKGYPLQYSFLENSMDCIVHGVSKSWTWLRNFHTHTLILDVKVWTENKGQLEALVTEHTQLKKLLPNSIFAVIGMLHIEPVYITTDKRGIIALSWRLFWSYIESENPITKCWVCFIYRYIVWSSVSQNRSLDNSPPRVNPYSFTQLSMKHTSPRLVCKSLWICQTWRVNRWNPASSLLFSC